MTPGLSFGGFPDKVRLSDWLLVEWVATARKGSAFPEPWCHAHSPLELGAATALRPGPRGLRHVVRA